MDGFEINKTICAVLVALLIGIVVSKVSDIVIAPRYLSHNAYPIDGAAPAADVGGVVVPDDKVDPIEPLLAAANVQNGQALAKKCLQCHSLESGGPNKVGPNLWNVVLGPLGHMPTYAYSSALSAMKAKGITWSYENLNQFLHKPSSFIAGTKMAFAGFKKTQDRADIVAYLRTLSDSPKPLPPVK